MKDILSLSVKLSTVSLFASAMNTAPLSVLADMAEFFDEENSRQFHSQIYSSFIATDGDAEDALASASRVHDEKKFGELCAALYSSLIDDNGKVRKLSEKVFDSLCRNENPVSCLVRSGKRPSHELLKRAEKEYGYIRSLTKIVPQTFEDNFDSDYIESLPKWKTSAFKPFSALLRSYEKNGCGAFYDCSAFSWDSREKKLLPVKSVNSIRLSDLKEYAEEKELVINNTLAFLKNLPANNVLLYGDRGTGKSSTVHAILNEYAKSGLRLVEMNKSAIMDFPLLVDAISAAKRFKFIIFIDDLSFSDGENDYAQLKAALEGSISKTPNILIYATTNRRHLIKETHADRRGDDVHFNDTTQEQLSLSDRFGLVVTFINPDKKEFCAILKAILHDRKIDRFDDETLSLYAERYAIKKGGRSPRAARQLADIIESSIKTGIPIGF